MAASIQMWFQGGLPQHCSPTTEPLVKLSTYFGVCVPTPGAAISTSFGIVSILAWLCAQVPQLIKNYQLKSTAGLSMFFLTEWLLGDATNLVGAVLTNQATWQIVVASYYFLVDTCLFTQFFWYRSLRSRFADGSVHSIDLDDDDVDDEMFSSLSPINTNFAEPESNTNKDHREEMISAPSKPTDTPRFSSVKYEKGETSLTKETVLDDKIGSNWFAAPSPRTVVGVLAASSLVSRAAAAPFSYNNHADGMVNIQETNAEYIGNIISWMSTVLYFGSRLPQIYMNWQRKSTSGLSFILFFAAFCGNFFYTSSLLTNPLAWNNFGPYGGHGWAGPHGSDRHQWRENAIPFLLGSAGCLTFDLIIAIQFSIYAEPSEKLIKVRDENGFSHWERVNGWMRGWVPTLARERRVDLAESQRLLSESRELEQHHSRYGGL